MGGRFCYYFHQSRKLTYIFLIFGSVAFELCFLPQNFDPFIPTELVKLSQIFPGTQNPSSS